MHQCRSVVFAFVLSAIAFSDPALGGEVSRMLDCMNQLERGFKIDGVWEPRTPDELDKVRIAVSAGDQLRTLVHRKVPLQYPGQPLNVYFENKVYSVSTNFLGDANSPMLRRVDLMGLHKKHYFRRISHGLFRTPVYLVFSQDAPGQPWTAAAYRDIESLPSIQVGDRTDVARKARDVFSFSKSEVVEISKNEWADNSRKVVEKRIMEYANELLEKDMPSMRDAMQAISSNAIRVERQQALAKLLSYCKGIKGRFEVDLERVLAKAASAASTLNDAHSSNGDPAPKGISPAK